MVKKLANTDFVARAPEEIVEENRERLQAFRDEASWQVLMRNGMNKDFSWVASAKEYIKVYDRARLMRAAG